MSAPSKIKISQSTKKENPSVSSKTALLSFISTYIYSEAKPAKSAIALYVLSILFKCKRFPIIACGTKENNIAKKIKKISASTNTAKNWYKASDNPQFKYRKPVTHA